MYMFWPFSLQNDISLYNITSLHNIDLISGATLLMNNI